MVGWLGRPQERIFKLILIAVHCIVCWDALGLSTVMAEERMFQLYSDCQAMTLAFGISSGGREKTESGAFEECHTL